MNPPPCYPRSGRKQPTGADEAPPQPAGRPPGTAQFPITVTRHSHAPVSVVSPLYPATQSSKFSFSCTSMFAYLMHAGECRDPGRVGAGRAGGRPPRGTRRLLLLPLPPVERTVNTLHHPPTTCCVVMPRPGRGVSHTTFTNPLTRGTPGPRLPPGRPAAFTRHHARPCHPRAPHALRRPWWLANCC